MISLDKGLLGQGQLGDVVARHAEYGRHVARLDVIVFCKPGFQVNKISENVTAYPTNSSNKLRYFFDAKKIGEKLSLENKYDLIVTQEPFLTGLVGVKLKAKFKAKLLVHFHGDFIGWRLFFARLFVLPFTDAFRVMSSGQKERLLKAGIKEDLIKIISTPVDLDKFDKYGGEPKQKYQIEQLSKSENDIKYILMVGRKDLVKDFNTLFKAIKLVYIKYPKIGLWLVGNYISKEITDKLNLPKCPVRLSGRVDSNELPAYYKASYLTVLSSISESFGKVLVEANACGKPVVSTATTGAKEIIQDGYNGFLVPIGDASALAEKILYLLNNPQKAKEMGENGRKLVKEKFSDNLDKVINFWQEIIEEKL